MHPLQHVGGGDVGHVERRVLPQQDDVEFGQLGALRLAEGEMVAGLVAHIERLHGREYPVAALGELVGGVIGQLVAAGLGFQHQCEGGIAADIDPLDRVHLDGDIQGHGGTFEGSGANLWLTNCCEGADQAPARPDFRRGTF